jgi:hypothetical protein
MADLFEHVRDSGFPFPGHLVHLFVGGSDLHGAKVHGTDDLDIYRVYIEPPEMVLGLESLAYFVWSTAGDGRRNEMGGVSVEGQCHGAALSVCRGRRTEPHLGGNREE